MTDLTQAHQDESKSLKPNDQQNKSLWSRGLKAVFWIAVMFSMIIMFTILFDVSYTRPYVHEVIATILMVILAFHIIRNRNFFSQLGRKNFPSPNGSKELLHYANRFFLLSDIINVFLILCAFVCFITGMMFSKFVFKDIIVPLIPLEKPSSVFRPIHAMSAYLLLVAIGLHAGLHLSTLFNFITDNLGKLWTRIIQGSMVIMGLHGLMCIFEYNFVSKFVFKVSKSIKTLNPDLPEFFYWCDLACIAVFFALISYALSVILTQRYIAAKKD